MHDAIIAIASELGETDTKALRHIGKYIQRLGMRRCIELVERAQTIYNNDGMNTLNGKRKRTLGGIWFRLAKDEYKAIHHAC